MSGSVNKVILVGNVGKDPEVRFLNDGGKVASFSVATSESWKDRNTGERKDRTEWHKVVVFNDRLVDVIERYVKKGAKLYLEGQLQTRKWTDQQGQEKYTTEVVLTKFKGELAMLDGRTSDSSDFRSESPALSDQTNSQGFSSGAPSFSSTHSVDDEIPF